MRAIFVVFSSKAWSCVRHVGGIFMPPVRAEPETPSRARRPCSGGCRLGGAHAPAPSDSVCHASSHCLAPKSVALPSPTGVRCEAGGLRAGGHHAHPLAHRPQLRAAPLGRNSRFFLPQPCRLPGLGAPRWAPPRQVVSDYVPMAARGAARAGVLGTTLVALAGLYKLNASGPGISKTVKQLWTK